MSKRNRIRFTKQQRREFKNRPHPDEEAESLTPVLDIKEWKPVDGIEDFIKNGAIPNKMKYRFPDKSGCRILFPDNEPYKNNKTMNTRTMVGEYPSTNLYGDEDFGLNGRWQE